MVWVPSLVPVGIVTEVVALPARADRTRRGRSSEERSRLGVEAELHGLARHVVREVPRPHGRERGDDRR